MNEAQNEAKFIIGDTGKMSAEELAQVTERTFEGYYIPIQHFTAGFANFARVCNLDVAQSVALRHRDGEAVGLAMLGIRGERGWCGGFGIVPSFRGRGLAAWLVEAFLERARNINLELVRLEVLTQNERAIKAYQRAGFETMREVAILSADAQAVRDSLAVREKEADRYKIETVTVEDALALRSYFEPSATRLTWQREPASLLAGRDITAKAAFHSGVPQAVLLSRNNFETGNLKIEMAAFREEAAVRMLLSGALAAVTLLSDEKSETAITNEPTDTPLYALLTAHGLRETNRQYEMEIRLETAA